MLGYTIKKSIELKFFNESKSNIMSIVTLALLVYYRARAKIRHFETGIYSSVQPDTLCSGKHGILLADSV